MGGLKHSLAFGVWLWLITTGASASGLAVEGIDQSRSLPPSGAQIENYENVGYALKIRDGEAHVRIEAIPLESKAPFLLPESKSHSPIERLARGLTADVETEFNAVSRILAWVARNIDYHLDRQQSQEAEDVLARRSAYCTGVARLTVALLEAVDIPAREVAGYVIESGGPGEPAGFHRWVEVWISDRGWVFSDPLRSHHYVAATYIRLASDELRIDAGLQGLLLERDDRVATVDLYPKAVPGILARRNSTTQLAAALRILIAEQPRGMAILTGDQVKFSRALVEGEVTFVGLEPGSYQLQLLLSDHGVLERQIDIIDRTRMALFLPAIRADESPRFGREMETE